MQQLELQFVNPAQSPGTEPPTAIPAPVPATPRLPVPTADRITAFRAQLERLAKLEIVLRVTNNSHTMLSIRPRAAFEAARVSVHAMFLDAPPEVVAALAGWIKNPRSKKHGPVLGAYIRENRGRVVRRAQRPVRVMTRGKHVDLQVLFDAVNAEHFGGGISTPITWGRMPATTRRRRSIRFGSFSPEDNLIRIHPLLDSPQVPEFFVRYIVFHEMLHADMGIAECANGRRAIHPPAFKQREQAYPGYVEAIRWMETPANLRRLLRGLPADLA